MRIHHVIFSVLQEGDGEDEGEEATSAESSDEVVVIPDPLKQLVQALSRQAQADQSTGAIADDDLYLRKLSPLMRIQTIGLGNNAESDMELLYTVIHF